ncbi:MAG: GMP synthase [Myxococcales bacterium]|nr:MAG: GMP synthase [Myxococcales bacterium]
MKLCCVTHVDFEGPGCLASWADAHGHELVRVQPSSGGVLPDTSGVDLLVVLGGPQSPLRLDVFPYLSDEIRWIETIIAQNKPVVGFCLGAQLIAEALGAKTERSREKEVGVFPVDFTKEGRMDPLLKSFPDRFDVLHWHYDMPGLPKDAVLLAQSNGCDRQAFRFGSKVYGFQFHMEFTHESILPLLDHAKEDLEPSRYTQSRESILNADFETMNQRLGLFLDGLSDAHR